MKKAFITGITGQDGSYLAELLLSKNYEVHKISTRKPNPLGLGVIVEYINYYDMFFHFSFIFFPIFRFIQ